MVSTLIAKLKSDGINATPAKVNKALKDLGVDPAKLDVERDYEAVKGKLLKAPRNKAKDQANASHKTAQGIQSESSQIVRSTATKAAESASLMLNQLDEQLDSFEQRVASVGVDRVNQSPARIAAYMAEALGTSSDPSVDLIDISAELDAGIDFFHFSPSLPKLKSA